MLLEPGEVCLLHMREELILSVPLVLEDLATIEVSLQHTLHFHLFFHFIKSHVCASTRSHTSVSSKIFYFMCTRVTSLRTVGTVIHGDNFLFSLRAVEPVSLHSILIYKKFAVLVK